ncbi:hypothetical protein KIV66_gp55 [Mycobacterium phage MyraDee]|uniref:Uncharacterized protein n=1 Tax=Mycobacterium phage MyraDee TaxID=2024303 RepID=A0A222YXY4_9CAUD|nr:hypothetical protein KIV66_gp55 [Mycobacterium phage MyraDee]ASR77162.1 hypothetical protein SEA_MYRADEE_55 [Mycobacterium phage MyraDee]
MDEFQMPCGCYILYELDEVWDYGYGGEVIDRQVLGAAHMSAPCRQHGGTDE